MADRTNHLEVLERYAWRRARIVLRGPGGRNPAGLLAVRPAKGRKKVLVHTETCKAL